MSINQLSLDNLLDVLGLPDGTSVTVTGPLEAAGFSDSSLASFSGSSSNPFLVISTGLASSVNGANTSGNQGTDLGAVGTAGDSLTFNFVVPRSANAASIAFDFTFLSEEFPEYVGSSFNDFLSVRLNGTEIALDTSGKPITVNNNFFNPALTSSGTIFDGQTPPLRITAPLSGTSDTLNLEIQIADVGDGIYDSAAFINNFELVEPQIFFVDFDGGTINYGTKFLFFDDEVTLPSSGLSAAEQNQIIANLNTIYSDFLVKFTTTIPIEGEFSTILVGGAGGDVPEFADPNSPESLLGRAEKIDYGNDDKSDNAFVLSGQPAFNSNGTANIPLLSQVLAHEAGHTLGLRHVLNTNELMYPFADASSTNIGGETSLAEIITGNVQPVGGTQNSREELIRNVGLSSSSELVAAESLFDRVLKFFGFNLNSTASTIFDAVIATVNPESEVLQLQELGDIPEDERIEFITPATDEDLVVFLGKSDADGPFDIFLSPGGVTKFDPSTANDYNLVETLGVRVADIKSETELVIADADGNLTTIGTPDVTLLDIGSSEATDGADVLTGTNGNDVVVGLGGDDDITGNAGDDQLFGNGGNDTLSGSAGNDYIDAGNGNDTVAGGLGDDAIYGYDGNDILRGDLNSRSPGGFIGGNDTIYGGSGNDQIGGKAGNDELYGDEGNDQLWGDNGDDLLWGGLGNDTLVGDDFSGGQGSDTFVLAVGEGTDTISDFQLSRDLLGLAGTGTLTFAQLSITQTGNNTRISVNDQTLAILSGVEATALTDSLFTPIAVVG